MNNLRFVNILELDAAIWEKVRQWRNKDEIRTSMLSQHNISEKEHRSWLEGLRLKNDRKFFVVFNDGIPVGSAYFHNIDYADSSSEWGFYIGDDAYKDKGLGKRIVFKLLGIFFGELKTKTLLTTELSHNKPAINIYNKFRFKECRRTPFKGGGEIIHMKFSARDWERVKKKAESYE